MIIKIADAPLSNNRPFVPDRDALLEHVACIFLFSQNAFYIQSFTVARKAFMDPAIGKIGGSHTVAPPFMCRFMKDDVIENAAVIILVSVPVSNGRLVLHPGIR